MQGHNRILAAARLQVYFLAGEYSKTIKEKSLFIQDIIRYRRNRNRRKKDTQEHSLLGTEEGRSLYWNKLAERCKKSSMIELLENVLTLEGDIVECGVFRGDSLRMICKAACESKPGIEKRIWGLDTFEGFPEYSVGLNDTSPFRPLSRLRIKFADAQDAITLLSNFASTFDIDLVLKKGFFKDTLAEIADRKFCFIHIDCDTYNSHMECLSALYDNLVPGGVIVYDDYMSSAWPGARRAIDEFLAEKPESVQVLRSREYEAWFSIKPV